MNSAYVSTTWGKMAAHPLSLLMILHKCHEYYDFCIELDDFCNVVRRAESGAGTLLDLRNGALSTVDKALKLLRSLRGVSPTVMRHIEDLGEIYNTVGLAPVPTVLSEMLAIQDMVRTELENRKFLYIPDSQDEFLRKKQLFGRSVYEMFPDARIELTDAGTAFAMELYTACVFHLMRVAEHGLRTLARSVKVRLTHKANFMPLDFGDWNQVITGIRGKIDAARRLTPGPRRQAKLEMYSNAADHCEYMKDIWRNTASHARKSYIESEALATMDRVKAFMQFLSVNL